MRSFLFRLGAACAAHPLRTLSAWMFALGLAIAAASTVGVRFADELDVAGTESQRAADRLAARFPGRGAAAVLVARTRQGSAGEPDNAAALAEVIAAVRQVEHVAAVAEPEPSPDGHAVMAAISFDTTAARLGASAAALAAITDHQQRLDVAVGGEAISMNQEPVPGPAEVIGLLVAALVLLFAFGSAGAAAIPIVTAVTSVVVGVIAVGLVGHYVALSSGAPMLAGMLGLGAGIDYALFLVTRARDELRACAEDGGGDVPAAVGRAVATAGRAVVFAGLAVVASILGLAFSGVGLINALGIASAVVVAVSVVAAVTLVPALLGLFGLRLDALRVPALGGDGAIFGRWARRIGARPWRHAVAGVVILLVLAAPAWSMRLGVPDDGAQPEASSPRRAYDLIAAHFGAGRNAPLVAVVEGGAGDAARVAGAIAADAEIASVEPPVPSADGSTHVVIAYPRQAPDHPAVAALIHRLRAIPTDVPVSIGGQIALTMDLSEIIADRLPLVIAGVLAATLVLLLIVFRSLVVPIKAVVLNLLSVGAAYGVLVAVFQWGLGRQLLGLDHAIPIVSLLPMLLFAVLFGLSMDYEVFLLARIREEHDHGVSTTESVARALTSTGRVVSSAALIMVTVFVAFALGPDPMVKMFGVGLATAIAVDATIVRLVLVPAFMVLMGQANWWMPRALERVMPRIAV